MEIRAYNETYLSNAMTTMATMLDYAVNYRHENIDTFFFSFILSPYCAQFENGNPMVIPGKTGVELYRLVRMPFDQLPPYVSIDRSPEFWLGWSLAFYQWHSCRTFREIVVTVPLSEMVAWYPTLHEADLTRFMDAVNERLGKRPTNLEILRKRANLSQSMLATLSGVSLRSIQTYEQRQNDISKAQFAILNSLARTLGCSIYELMDSDTTLHHDVPSTESPFERDMRMRIEQLQQEKERLRQQQAQHQAQLDAYRYNYISQIPCRTLPNDNRCYVQPQAFENHWNNYWNNIINQQPVPADDRKRAQEASQYIAKTILKEAIGQAIKSTGNKPASVTYDALCLLKAENIWDATRHILGIIESCQNSAIGK